MLTRDGLAQAFEVVLGQAWMIGMALMGIKQLAWCRGSWNSSWDTGMDMPAAGSIRVE